MSTRGFGLRHEWIGSLKVDLFINTSLHLRILTRPKHRHHFDSFLDLWCLSTADQNRERLLEIDFPSGFHAFIQVLRFRSAVSNRPVFLRLNRFLGCLTPEKTNTNRALYLCYPTDNQCAEGVEFIYR